MGQEIEKSPEEQLLELMGQIVKKANEKSKSSRSPQLTTQRVVFIIKENSEIFQSLIEHFASGSEVLNIRHPNFSIYHNQNPSRRAIISDPGSPPEEDHSDEDYLPFEPPTTQRGRRNATLLNPEIMNIFLQTFSNTHNLQQDPHAPTPILPPNDQQSQVRNRHRINQNPYMMRSIGDGTAAIPNMNNNTDRRSIR